jgi:hypothetical protein
MALHFGRTNPFQLVSGTVSLGTATSTAGTGVQIPATSAQASEASDQWLVNVFGNVDVYLGIGATASIAQTNAVAVSTAGTYTGMIPVRAGTVQVFSAPPGWYVSAITAAGASGNITITPGAGS